MENFIINKKLRKKLKKPLGKLITNIKDIKDIKEDIKDRIVICVGDETSERILNLNIKPKICIYDGKIMRRPIEIPAIVENFNAQEIRIKNPPGKLTKRVFESIKKGVTSKGNVKIYVDGEEDLATLAAIHLSPFNSIVLYGQPNQGLVLVKVNEKIKSKVKEILEEMKKKEE